MKAALHRFLAVVALTSPYWVARGAETPPAEDPIAVLLREREALTGEQVTTTPEVYTGQMKVTVDITDKPHDEALKLVNLAIKDSSISFRPMQDGTKQARRSGANAPKGAPDPEAKVTRFYMSNVPLDHVLNAWLGYTGKTLVLSLDLLNGPGINANVSNVTKRQAAIILRDALRLQAGLLLNETSDGSLQVRRDPSFKAAERAHGVFSLQNVPADNLLGVLLNLPKNFYDPPALAVNSSLVSVEFSYRTNQEEADTLRAALASQAGIIVDQQPDGSWLVQPPSKSEHFAAPDAAPKS